MLTRRTLRCMWLDPSVRLYACCDGIAALESWAAYHLRGTPLSESEAS